MRQDSLLAIQAADTSAIPSEITPLLPSDSAMALTSNRQQDIPPSSIYQKIAQSSLFKLLPSILIGSILWFGTNPTEELTTTSIRLLAVFTSCIFALITTSVDISILVLTALTLLSITKSFQCQDSNTGLSVECRLCGELDSSTGATFNCDGGKEAFQHSLDGFSSSVVWLIFAAFHLGKAVEVTQLGKRISLWMIRSFGKHIIGLAYAILLSELLLAPFVPSNTARGGGIILPVVHSIATTIGSSPTHNPKIGSFLMLVGAHSNLLSASMYMTGMAPNPIVVNKANTVFPDLHFSFMTWIKGSSVPALFSAVVLPLFLAWSCDLFKVKIGSTEEGQQLKSDEGDIVQHATTKLKEMGSMTTKELQLCFVLFSCLFLWITAGYTNIDATLVALLGVVTLLHMGTVEWKDLANNKSAWETLFWLGGFVTIAAQLSESGASAYLGGKISLAITQMKLPAIPALAIAYFVTTFMFSSISAHTVAFITTFLEAGRALGANPLLLTGLLAYFGVLGGCMTNFSSGSSVMYYATGYITRGKWFSVGAQCALLYMVIYFTVGMGWWKLLGWF